MKLKKNIAVYDLPKRGQVRVTRERALRNPIFERTRIVGLCLILMLVLACISGTLAFVALTYPGNQTPNRFTSSDGFLQIVENLNGSTADVVNTDSTFDLGLDNKKVRLRARAAAEDAPNGIYVRVAFMPQALDVTHKTVRHMFGETWSDPKTDDDGTYIETDLVKLYINPDYASYWDYKDGTFTSKEVLTKGEETPILLYGAVAQEGVDETEYSNILVSVIASSIESGAKDKWQ